MAESKTKEMSDISEKDSECAVCLQKYVQPVSLPCEHIFCYLCAKGMSVHSKKCALCRKRIPDDYFSKPKVVTGLASEQKEAFHPDTYMWFYKGHHGWWQYDTRTSLEIEEAFVQNKQNVKIMISGFIYVIDFQQMIQYRETHPQRYRGIKRDLTSIPDKKGVAGLSDSLLQSNKNDVGVGVDASVAAKAYAPSKSSQFTAGSNNRQFIGGFNSSQSTGGFNSSQSTGGFNGSQSTGGFNGSQSTGVFYGRPNIYGSNNDGIYTKVSNVIKPPILIQGSSTTCPLTNFPAVASISAQNDNFNVTVNLRYTPIDMSVAGSTSVANVGVRSKQAHCARAASDRLPCTSVLPTALPYQSNTNIKMTKNNNTKNSLKNSSTNVTINRLNTCKVESVGGLGLSLQKGGDVNVLNHEISIGRLGNDGGVDNGDDGADNGGDEADNGYDEADNGGDEYGDDEADNGGDDNAVGEDDRDNYDRVDDNHYGGNHGVICSGVERINNNVSDISHNYNGNINSYNRNDNATGVIVIDSDDNT